MASVSVDVFGTDIIGPVAHAQCLLSYLFNTRASRQQTKPVSAVGFMGERWMESDGALAAFWKRPTLSCHLYVPFTHISPWHSQTPKHSILCNYTEWSKSFCAPDDHSAKTRKNSHTIGDLNMTITEYIRNVDRAIPNAVFENTVRRVNKCLETGGGHFEHYL
jgi:hypothetical protein